MDEKDKINDNKSIKLDDRTLEEVEINLLNEEDDEIDDENQKVKDFYDYDESIFDFGTIGSVGSNDDLFQHKKEPKNKFKNPLKENTKQTNVNLFDDDKQKIFDMFNENEIVGEQSTQQTKPKQTNKQQQTQSEDIVLIKDEQNEVELNSDEQLDENKIKSLIESALYVYGNEGLSIQDLKKLTLASSSLIKKIMKKWTEELDNDSTRGVTIKIYGDRYKLFSKADNREQLSKLITIRYKNPLTTKVVETLAIIAYNQPCTRAIIENIRGKDPSFAIQKLIELGLIEEIGRSDEPGRPLLYEVTHKFYDVFGIKNVKDLPIINLDQPFQDDDISFFDTTRFND